MVQKDPLNLVALPQTWTIGVILDVNDERMSIGTFPVIGMYTNGDVIEPVVALQNGHLVRSSELQWEVLFLAAPGEDPRKMARLALYARGTAEIQVSIDDDDIDDLNVS